MTSFGAICERAWACLYSSNNDLLINTAHITFSEIWHNNPIQNPAHVHTSLRGKKGHMKNISNEEKQEILSKTFLTIDDLYKVLPVGKNQAARIFKDIEKECKRKEIPLFITRPRIIPTEMLLEKYPILKRGLK